MVYENNKIHRVVCPTIESFTKKFPCVNEYELLDINPFKIMKELKIPECLLIY